MAKVRDEIYEILHSAKKTADFARQNVAQQWPNPALSVEGLGLIRLPISTRDAQAMIDCSQRSAFGFKSETRIDLTVRQSYELNPSQFKLENAEWNPFLDDIVAEVSEAFGVSRGSQNVRAELYKLLIYETGGKFDKHKDTEKTTGMFGTLVITLPCEHTGGQVVVEHAGSRKVFQTAPNSKFAVTWLAWFSDVAHHVQEVQSGHRIVLTYNLVRNSVIPLTAEQLCGGGFVLPGLIEALRRWGKGARYGEKLVYLLGHEYTESSLSLGSLKGQDYRTAVALRETAKTTGLSVSFASLERELYGGCDGGGFDDYGYGYGGFDHYGYNGGGSSHDITDVIEDSATLRKVYNLDGEEIGNEVSIHRGDILQGDNAFGEPDDEDYSGYTGNEGKSTLQCAWLNSLIGAGVSNTQWYRRCAIVLSSEREKIYRVFQSKQEQSQIELEIWIDSLISDVEESPTNNASRQELTEAITCVLQHAVASTDVRQRFTRWTNRVPGLCATAALKIESGELLLQTAELCGEYDPAVCYALGKGNGLISLDDQRISKMLKILHTSNLANAILHFSNGYMGKDFEDHQSMEPPDASLYDWAERKVRGYSSQHKFEGREDAAGLAQLSKWFPHLVDSVFTPILQQHANEGGLGINFLSALGREDRLSASVRGNLIELRKKIIGTFRCAPAKVYPQLFRFHAPEYALYSSSIANVLIQCIHMDLEPQATVLEKEMINASSNGALEILPAILIPFLQDLLRLWDPSDTLHLEEDVTPLSSQGRWQSLFRVIFHQYIHRYIGREPLQRVPTWARDPVDCPCHDCQQQLNPFLQTPNEREIRFPFGARRRRHIKGQLYGTDTTTKDAPVIPEKGRALPLIVTKTNETAKKKHKEWTERRAVAKTTVLDKTAHPDLLKALLGSAHHNAIVAFLTGITKQPPTLIQPGGSAPLSQTNANANVSADESNVTRKLGPGAGTKRKAAPEPDAEGTENDPVVLE